MKKILIITFILSITNSYAQNATIYGTILLENKKTKFITVSLLNTSFTTLTNQEGEYTLSKIPYGKYIISAKFLGYKELEKKIELNDNNKSIQIDLNIKELELIDEVVITATKTYKKKTNSQVVVNVINSKTLDNIQACNLAEGLKFQPGLRVETDCQTCNYTQLRINGLTGSYSQILINGKSIYSPLTGLYGMEQIPVNMISKIEVIKGAGSSLYGSSAIGGTINVITKTPIKDNYNFNYNYQNINNQANDHQYLGNLTKVSENKQYGISIFINYRNRDLYDHNEDNFSEIPLIHNISFGTNSFKIFKNDQKIEFNLIYLDEYRLGGEMRDLEVHLLEQAEERRHNIWMSSLDYEINFNNKSSLTSYLAWQQTTRDHYTGILPENQIELQNHLEDPPYGNSNVKTLNGGIQLNYEINRFLNGKNKFTIGSEYILDNVYDNIPSYDYNIKQKTRNIGFFVQSDWLIIKKLSLLSGFRIDKHNLINKNILNPRTSLLYKLKNTQLRLSYGTGFRAPQAFDTDLHIAFAGGGVSRVNLSPDLIPEKSESVSGSINFDKGNRNFVFGFTLEGFLTILNNTFFLKPIGEDNYGNIFEKQNGSTAKVNGLNIETRINYNQKIQVESGITLQSSKFNKPVIYIEGIEGIEEFTRTPNDYGFAILSIYPKENILLNLNYIYTGKMKVPHFSGSTNQFEDEIITTNIFHELSSKVSYTLEKKQYNMEFYAGIKNILNSYQKDFDIGRNRDSNFIYGPSQPRTLFLGLQIN